MSDDPVARDLAPRRLLVLCALGATLLIVAVWLVVAHHRSPDESAGPSLARTAWPMLHCDAQHSRRAAARAPYVPREMLSVALDGLSVGGLAVGASGEVIAGSAVGSLRGIPLPASGTMGPDDAAEADAGWVLDLPAPLAGTPAVRSDGVVCAALEGGELIAIGPDAREVWRQVLPATATSPAMAADGAVIVGAIDGHVYALSAEGAFLWSAEVEGSVSLAPTLLPGGDLAVATDEGRLFRLSADGHEVWSLALDSPAVHVAATGRLILVAERKGCLAAYGHDGRLQWSLPLADTLTGMAVARNGSIYATGTTDPRDRGGRAIIATPAERGAVLYGVAPEGKLAWHLDLEDTPLAPIVAGDGTILVATGDEFALAARSRVYAVSPEGEQIWDYAVPDVAGHVSDMIPARDAVLCLLIRGESPATSRAQVTGTYPGRIVFLATDTGEPQPYSPPE